MLLLRPSPWILAVTILALSICSGASDKSKSPRSPNTAYRGKFNLKTGMQCSWATKDVKDEVKMAIKCENPRARIHGGETDLQCEYSAKPQTCPGFRSNPKGFYKQVSRALKKLQGKLCRDERALVKAGMCKRAPRDAHFKVDIETSVAGAQSGGDTLPQTRTSTTTRSTTTTTRSTTTTTPATPVPSGSPTACTKRDNRQVAQEYCSSSWASVCSFFFSMLQSEDC